MQYAIRKGASGCGDLHCQRDVPGQGHVQRSRQTNSMDPFSAIGTIVGLLGVALQLKTSISRCIHATQGGPSEVRALAVELKNTSFPLARLETILQQSSDGQNTQILPEETTRELHGVLLECKRVVEQLHAAIEASKLDSNSYRGTDGSLNLRGFRKQWAKIKFGLGNGQRNVDRLKNELAMHKKALSFTLLLITFSTTRDVHETTTRIAARLEDGRRDVLESIDRAVAAEESNWDQDEVIGSTFQIERYLTSAASIYTASRPCSPHDGPSRVYRRIHSFPKDLDEHDSGIDVTEAPEIEEAGEDAQPETEKMVKLIAAPEPVQPEMSTLERPTTRPTPLVIATPQTLSPPSSDTHDPSLDIIAISRSPASQTTPAKMPLPPPAAGRALTPNLPKKEERQLPLSSTAFLAIARFKELGSGRHKTSLQSPPRASTATATPLPLPSASSHDSLYAQSSYGMELVPLNGQATGPGESTDGPAQKQLISPPRRGSGGRVIAVPPQPTKDTPVTSGSGTIALTPRPIREISPPHKLNVYSPERLRRPQVAPPISPRAGIRAIPSTTSSSSFSSSETTPPPHPHAPPRQFTSRETQTTKSSTSPPPEVNCDRPGCRRFWSLRRIFRLWLTCLTLLFAHHLHTLTKNSLWRQYITSFASDVTGIAWRKLGQLMVLAGAAPSVTVESSSVIGRVPGWYLGMLRERVEKKGRVVERAPRVMQRIAGAAGEVMGRGGTGSEMVRAVVGGAAVATASVGWGVSSVVGLLAAAPVL
ncbi:hypothetical protein DFH27DRAFT_618189 [Peziza echinospora]|nr:hypothetical protein DFH27DRAFT_618189 [Peziza echinospora]